MTSKHDFCGISCKHNNLKFCAHCNVPYCKDCGKEWKDNTLYGWYTTYSNQLKQAQLNGSSLQTTVSDTVPVTTTCNHEG